MTVATARTDQIELRVLRAAIVSANRFESKMLCDVLRQCNVAEVKLFRDWNTSLVELTQFSANVLIIPDKDEEHSGLDWVRALRRASAHPNQKIPVFVLVDALTLSLAQACCNAGANAVIGRPISGGVIISTIRKVLARPRAFIEEENYVGPCRRAGIITVPSDTRRRLSDNKCKEQEPATFDERGG